MTVEKPQPKLLLRPITTGTGSAMNQSQFLAIICNSLKAREKSRVHGAIGFGFASHWLKNSRESFKPVSYIIRSSADQYVSHVPALIVFCFTVCMWYRYQLNQSMKLSSSSCQVDGCPSWEIFSINKVIAVGGLKHCFTSWNKTILWNKRILHFWWLCKYKSITTRVKCNNYFSLYCFLGQGTL
mgnify:CR=1 FL=1